MAAYVPPGHPRAMCPHTGDLSRASLLSCADLLRCVQVAEQQTKAAEAEKLAALEAQKNEVVPAW